MHPVAAKLLEKYKSVFPDKLPNGLPKERAVEHSIDLIPDAKIPAVRPLQKNSYKDLEVIEEYVKTCLESGSIRTSNSPYGAMTLVVKKKDGDSRVVVDYRGLNEITIKNRYPLPLMDELFDRVHGATVFTKIDLRTGFHQIRLRESDCEKTAFRTRYGSFEYRVLPMGLCNAPSTFMRLMNETFKEMLDKTVLVFLDDILIFSKSVEDHERHVAQALDKLKEAKLYAKLSKCEFFKDEVEFLGHRIGKGGLATSPDKIEAVSKWPPLKSVTECKSIDILLINDSKVDD